MVKRRREVIVEKIGVKEIPTDELIANPHNPRRLFDDLPMKTLRESIEKVGILVPLTVYRRGKDGAFVILDGQRRWICAQRLDLGIVPVNQITEPDVVQNIVTMFQIHKLREDWELMPTALKLERLMEELQEKSDKKLAVLTGLNVATVTRCKKLLSYKPDFQDLMLDVNPEQRVKADFFIELHQILVDRVVKKHFGYSRNKLTIKMLAKYQSEEGGIKAVTDFRKVKQYITNAKKADKIKVVSNKFREFVEQIELTPDHLIIDEADVSAKARSLTTKIVRLQETLSDLDIESYVGEEEFWESLESLLGIIRKHLEKSGRRVKE